MYCVALRSDYFASKMEEELIKEVKIKLRSLVVSSPTQMDSRLLMRDYSNLLGTRIPLARMGYRDFVTFLREQCSDSFLLSGPPSNPILTVIVPESSKHIDNFVQRSKLPSTAKIKTKRRSIQESKVNPKQESLIYNSFVEYKSGVIKDPKKAEVKAPDVISNSTRQNKENVDHRKNTVVSSNDVNNKKDVDHHTSTTVTSSDVRNFLKKRIPLYNSSYELDEAIPEKDGAHSVFQEDYSRRRTSNGKGSKSRQFEEFKTEIMELITASPEGVWCTDLIRLYRERYNRELNFTRFGYTSIISLAYALEEHVHITRPVDTGDWLLMERSRAAAAPAPPRSRASLAPRTRVVRAAPADDADDALPGIQFDPDVFPEDCVGFMESIPSQSLADCRTGAMLEVMVGEVYSPSHFWLIRIGEHYNEAMEEIMDEMTLYYNGKGRDRVLARGAVRVGHYCSTLYENDWHRSVIVKIIDSDTVKVRHVDYGTVETVPVRGLRALRRQWAALPAQAIRARLAGLRPAARGRRWPHAAATRFLRLVHNARLYANVVAVDTEHDVLETLLIDTRGADDMCLSAELIRCGHADPRADSMLRTKECYLYPRFEALENGDTPNMAEIHAYLRDGIALDYVDSYRRHVPACLPSPSPPSSEEPEPGASPKLKPDPSPEHEPHPGPEHEPHPGPEHEPNLSATETKLGVVSPPSSAGCGEEPRYQLYASPPPCSPEPAKLPTRIPLVWPNARSAAPPVTREDSPCVPSAPSSSASTHRLPEHIPVQPASVGYLPPWSGGVVLSRAECDTYYHLSRVSPHAAHWYMVGTLARAMGAPPTLGPGPIIGPFPAIGPLPAIGPGPSMGPIRAPPGFGA